MRCEVFVLVARVHEYRVQSGCPFYPLVHGVVYAAVGFAYLFVYPFGMFKVFVGTFRLSSCTLLNDMAITVIFGCMSCFGFVVLLPTVSGCSGI